MKKKAYIIGIAGKATASLAEMFIKMGWEVEGSDQGCYPPASTFLDTLGVKYHIPYSADNLKAEPDLVVVGGNALIVDKNNPEFFKAKELGLKVVGFPEVLREFVVKKNSIVSVGNYGKTSTVGILSWVLYQNGFDPSFMIGAIPLNFNSGIRISAGNWSVLEGDEHPTIGYSPKPKFYWYDPTILLFTSAQWDHINVYPTEEAYVQVYKEQVKTMPKDGVIVACLDGQHVSEVIKEASCEVVTYSVHDTSADYYVEKINYGEDLTRFTVNGEEIESPLMGEHNVQNALGCLVVCQRAGVSTKDFSKALKEFKGINRRLEVRGVFNGVTVIDDHAHSPVKAKASLDALRTRYKKNIIAVFDPSYSALRERSSLAWYPGMFDRASEVVLAKVTRVKKETAERVTGLDIIEAISKTQPKAKYLPLDDNLIDYITSKTGAGDVIVFMSSAGLRGMIEKTISKLNEK